MVGWTSCNHAYKDPCNNKINSPTGTQKEREKEREGEKKERDIDRERGREREREINHYGNMKPNQRRKVDFIASQFGSEWLVGLRATTLTKISATTK